MIRRDESASMLAGTNLFKRSLFPVGGIGAVVVVPVKTVVRFITWLTTGRKEVEVRGLGIPVSISTWKQGLAGDRGVIVPLKPVKVGGGKGTRKVDVGGKESHDS